MTADGDRPRFGRALLSEWLLDDGVTFLNHGSFGATPRVVMAEQDLWRRRLERQPVAFMNRTLTEALRAAAAEIAAFLGADADGLVFTTNTTEAVNGVLRSVGLGPGDRVVTTSFAYPAVANALRHICAQGGATVVTAELPFPLMDSDAIVAAVEKALGPGTRLAVFDHIASHQGAILPIERLIAVCHARGVPVLIDGAHGPGLMPLDLKTLGADWYAGNCHKWLYAPKGCAVLWTRPERRADTHPAVISNQFGQGYTAEFDWTGTRDPSAWLAAPAGLAFLRRLGTDRARAYMATLARDAGNLLADAWSTQCGVPADMAAAMTIVRAPALDSADWAGATRLHDRLIDTHHIEVPVFPLSGALWIRISAQVYNDIADYERLAVALAK